jgi:pimeloyl-ACP methyl ester carboxylesterase
MPYFIQGNARIYFEDSGTGEPVIAVHGLIENTMYWNYVSEILSGHCRFISMDMRAHGQTRVTGESCGFDVETIGNDIMALADHLHLDRFHVLSHSTGGFAAVRHAMKDSGRFASLILTNTGSSTSPVPGDPEYIRRFHDKFAQWFEQFDWDQMIENLRRMPGPFFRGIIGSERREELLIFAREMIGRGDRKVLAAFIRSFYKDSDPQVEGLRKIKCPVLIIFGEKDDLFIESSRLMAREIAGAQLREYAGVGHMTALETPELLVKDVLSFILAHPA